ncbi:MAG TPA: GntR family transcriptional regulator [Actinophytocola sp.]|uniref:GntR family transcriptional regulator n=1 Tax=Actinophytocola sp. TaxID=1872138 RepID=UPI002E0856DE|nr:GntR family transcriptional regulator [Actinophytocola sp.]
MSSGPTDARPLQIRVVDELRRRIEVGDYRPGQQLPTLDELADQFSCSLAVTRRAVDLLKQQGLVVTVQGKGTFVRERPHARRHAMERYSRQRRQRGEAILVAEAQEQGHTVNQLIRELAEVPAPVRVAERLRITRGTPVWVRRRTTLIDGRPSQLEDSYYELAVVDGTRIREEDTGPGGSLARLEDMGFLLDQIEEEIDVRMPTGPESVALRLPAGTPVWELRRTVYDTTGRPVEVTLAVIAGDMTTFTYRFKFPD